MEDTLDQVASLQKSIARGSMKRGYYRLARRLLNENITQPSQDDRIDEIIEDLIAEDQHNE